MLKYVWYGLILIGTIVAVIKGTVPEVTENIFDMAQVGVDISLGFIATMALWLGVMRIAEDSGLMNLFARAISPALRWLFPGVPKGHAAMGSISMNIAANVIGLGNAATPFGLKAMDDLQTLNDNKEEATDEMCMFLAINTSSVTLIPATMIAVRASLGAQDPSAIIGATLFATLISTTVAIIAAKTFSKLPVFSRSKNQGGNV